MTLALGIAGCATLAGTALPLLGGPVIAIVIGVLLSALVRERHVFGPGIDFSGKTVLQLAVVVLGSQLSLGEVAGVGLSSLPVMLGTLAACLAATWVVGRRLGIEGDLRTLIGVGTGVCGASAIAAVSPVIRARHHDVAYAVSTIFCFNIAAVIVFPPLGHLLGLSQTEFGLFAGTAVNDTSSVVAAATTYGAAAGNHAVVVKLTRTLMIIPICLVLGAIANRRSPIPTDGSGATRARTPRVPWFLTGFLLVAAANSLGLIPQASHAGLQHGSVLLITMAMAGIGLSTDFGALRRTGYRPLLLGAILWIVVTATSLVLQLASR